ncbi:HAMP domain-containing sensor histidine kinase [Cohnella lubricantis]|uniref:histidine kinase n=1 Tax=Cohnella lubricantis TaxID=2163172 RepID=A0A841T8L9_9BACL|nr:HAMP domain-containing sensor histidine kinase [Cohnella lubricantis]MBB6677654.1 HAMP domain-containing protein [Cohnella lubricantis]MBP2116458.1 signal transduction histidine kinase [Cohnella lubricantis]
MIRWNGITVKLLLAFFAVLLISFAVTSAVSIWLVRSALDTRNSRFEGEQLNVAAALVRSSYRELWDEKMLASALQIASGPMSRTIYVLGADGSILMHTGGPNPIPLPPVEEEPLSSAVKAGKTVVAEAVSESGSPTLSAAPVGGDLQAKTVVILSRENRRDFILFTGIFRNILISTLVTACIIVFLVSGRMTSRLRRMKDAAQLIAKGRFDVRLSVRPKDEIGELAESLNLMSEELGGLDRMRREFLANVSHDLRSPLTSIGGYVEAMIDGAVPEDKQGKYLQLIREQTQRMNRLVSDLLDMARMEAGQVAISPAPYNLTEWVRRLLAGLDPEFRKRSLRFELTGDPDDIWVMADPHRIDQVLSNLLLNAIQFSPNGKKVEVFIERQGNHALISVRDEGVGISKDNLERIWQRFYKSDKARSAHAGSGLGLSIVKHVLDMHGSSVQVESRQGEGSRFSFELPIAEPPVTGRSKLLKTPPSP